MENTNTITNKEIVIHNVIAAMATVSEVTYLKMLEDTLRQNLRGLKLEEECTDLSTYVDDNEHILKVFVASKKIQGCKDNTLEQYVLTVRQLFQYVQKNFRDIKRDDIKLFLSYRMMNVSKTTVRNSYLNLSSFFGWLHEEGYIGMNPSRVGRIREEEIENIHLTPEEEVKVKDVPKTIREAAIVDFLLSTGVRVGELVSLDITDVDFNSGTVTFRGEKGSRRYRTVMLNAAARKHLIEYLQSRKDCNPALFVTDRNYNGMPRRMSNAAVEKLTKGIGERAGINKSLTVHVFRRTFATRLADKGCPLQTIQELMGHVKPETTLRYIAKSSQRLTTEAAKYFAA